MLALGEAAVGWTGLHEVLAMLFRVVSRIPEDAVSNSIWHEVKNDRFQRDMLLAAARRSHELKLISTQLFREIEWLLKHTTEIATLRDNILHSPIIASPTGVRAYNSGHARAKNLVNKDLLSEFRWCRDISMSLNRFALNLYKAMRDGKTSRLPKNTLFAKSRAA